MRRSTNSPIATTRTRPPSRTITRSSCGRLIWVPGSPIDCAETIPALSFGSIRWDSYRSEIFVSTSRSFFRPTLIPCIFVASSATRDRGRYRPTSFSAS